MGYKVKATQQGYDGCSIRNPGDIFEIDKPELFSKKWMELLDGSTYMYHEAKAPDGKIFPAEEAEKLGKVGWVDTQEKFGKGFRPRIVRYRIRVCQFCRKEWKWIIGIMVAIAAVIVNYING